MSRAGQRRRGWPGAGMVRRMRDTVRSMTGQGPAYLGCAEHCGRLDDAGVAAERDDLVDYSAVPTTPDQLRIETVLGGLKWQGADILHVGIGDSGFATRFGPSLGRLVGITISENERRLGESLALPNYEVHRVSKYSRQLIERVAGPFDFIIDNNPNSFACCKFHFHQMLDTYCAALKPGGVLLTDQGGMNWVYSDQRWRFGFAELRWLETLFPVQAQRLTASVYGLARRGAASLALCLDLPLG